MFVPSFPFYFLFLSSAEIIVLKLLPGKVISAISISSDPVLASNEIQQFLRYYYHLSFDSPLPSIGSSFCGFGGGPFLPLAHSRRSSDNFVVSVSEQAGKFVKYFQFDFGAFCLSDPKNFLIVFNFFVLGRKHSIDWASRVLTSM